MGWEEAINRRENTGFQKNSEKSACEIVERETKMENVFKEVSKQKVQENIGYNMKKEIKKD